MKYIDLDTLNSINPDEFRNTRPYPWANPQGFLTNEGFKALTEVMPDISLFEKSFGYSKTRNYNQQFHKRFILEYKDGMDLPAPWLAFINELQNKPYQQLIKGMVGTRFFKLRFYWHYTPQKCAVAPHCDSSLKLATQIYYMNTEEEWDPNWGGQTVVLDDNRRFDRKSNPDFDDFDNEIVAETMGNRSFFFGRNGNSWHGVRPITAPEGKFRKVFIVVFEDADPIRVTKKAVKNFKRRVLNQTT